MTVRNRLADEDGIVWLEALGRLDYVRQSWHQCATRRRQPRWDVGRLVGYTTLHPRAENDGWPGAFTRRVFWLKAHDRDAGADTYRTGAPHEAVDPRTVAPGVDGTMTDRAWGAA